MSQFRRLLKAAKVTATQLSEAMGMPIRTLTHNYNSGRIPYALVYKIHKVTGTPMDEVVPPALADSWLYLFDEQTRTNLPRGVEAQGRIKTRKERVTSWEQDGPPKRKKKDVPRETPKEETVPEQAYTPVEADKPKIISTSTKPISNKKSIADLMKQTPAPEPSDEGAPDFSKIDDSLFNTSADQKAGR